MIRNKFGSLRRRPRSSDENLDRNLSLDRLNDCRMGSFRRPTSPEVGCFDEMNECSKSDSDFVEEQKPEGLNSASSMESCTESREHIPLSRRHSSLTRKLSPLVREHSPLSRVRSLVLRGQDHSDSDDSTTNNDSRLEGDVIDNNNHDDKRTLRQHRRSDDATEVQMLTRKKLGKRNSFTNAVKHFFVSKSR